MASLRKGELSKTSSVLEETELRTLKMDSGDSKGTAGTWKGAEKSKVIGGLSVRGS